MAMRSVSESSLKRFVPCAALAVLTLATATAAEARGRHAHRMHAAAAHRTGPVPHTGRVNFGQYVGATNFAAIVVDANSGRTLYAVNEDAPRHPASITKVMTLYLLFEALEKGRMRLDTPLSVSAHAAAQAPTKLGLRPGSTIRVEDAIKAIVTKSANDMAVTVAENLAGDEESFAAAMTDKARELGMSHTFYHNASGLPDMRQITTARDLTLLGRAIRDRFPRYYRFFSTPSFTYAGSFMANHNHLMSRFEGMDGIKTGYTGASGFNLLSSVSRDGRHVVAVVMGGRTAAGRDRVMQSLLETHFEEASATPSTRVAEASPVEDAAETPRPVAAEPPVDRQPPRRLAAARDNAARDDAARDDAAGDYPDRGRDGEDAPPARVSFANPPAAAPAPRPIERQPPRGPSLIAPELALPTPSFVARPAPRPVEMARPLPAPRPVEPAALPPRPVKLAARVSDDKVRPAFIAGAPKAIDPTRLPAPLAADRRRLVLDGSTNHGALLSATSRGAVATATPSTLRWVTGAQPVRLGPSAPPRDKADAAPTGSIAPKAEARAPEPEAAPAALDKGTPEKGTWVIQVGATDDADKATDLLNRAKSEGRAALASARPFTEKVKKGDATLYRARFAGLGPSEAEAACKALRRSGLACFATRN